MPLAARAVPGAPWYRQFWPWFLLALPAASVVGGVLTLVIAVRNADSVVRDDWYKSGLAINADLARERIAADLGIVATVVLDERRGEIRVGLGGPAPEADAALELELHHPTQASRDRAFHLVRDTGGAYRCAVTDDLRGRWHVTLVPATGAWKLAGAVALAPGTPASLAPRP